MTRKIWQGDFARFWFGAGSADQRRRSRSTAPCGRQPADQSAAPVDAEPLGIVERNRRARREKWALKLDQ